MGRRTLEVLRGLLYERPSEAVWARILEIIAQEQDPGTQAIAVDYAEPVVERWPLLVRAAPRPWWRARLSGREPPGWRLARCLDLSEGDHKAKGAISFLQSRHIEALPGLRIRRGGLRVSDLGKILGAGHLDHLSALDLSHNPLSLAEVVEAIGAAGTTEALTLLRLRGNKVSPGDVARLQTAAVSGRLEELDLSETAFDSGTLLALMSSEELGRLVTLRLEDAGLDERQAEAFGGYGPSDLKHLMLAGNALRGGGLWELAESSLLGRLVTLDLSRNGLFWRDLRALATSAGQVGLRRLVLDGNTFEDEGVRHLARWDGLGGLRDLSLVGCRLTDAGAEALTAAPWAPGLERLDLSGNEIGEPGREALRRIYGHRFIEIVVWNTAPGPE